MSVSDGFSNGRHFSDGEVLLSAREQRCREGQGLQGLHCSYESRMGICSRNGTSFVGCIKIIDPENMEKVKDM